MRIDECRLTVEGTRPAKAPQTLVPVRGYVKASGRAGTPNGLGWEEAAAFGPRQVEHLAHGHSLRAGDPAYLVEFRGRRDHAALEARDLVGDGAVGRGERHH